MSELSNQNTSPGLPDGVMDAIIRGNILYPQMIAGHIILGGSRAAQLVLDGKADWQDCFAQPSDAQADQMGTAVNRVHQPYNIPYFYCNEVDTTILKEDGLFGLFGRPRIHGLVNDATGRIINTAVRYGTDVLWSTRSSPTTNFGNKQQRLNTLFSDQRYRPQAEALTAMWGVAAGVLESKEGRRFAKIYRANIPPAEEGLARYRLAARNKVCGIVSRGLQDWLSQQHQAREHISSGAVGQFILDTMFDSNEGALTHSANTAHELASASPTMRELFL